MAQDRFTMKLLIDGPSQKVLFAEAGKDVVDFLFSLLAMPLGTITKLLTKDSMVGCLGILYQSLENLEETYLQSNTSKTALLEPAVSPPSLPTSLLLPSPTNQARNVYRCCVESHRARGCYCEGWMTRAMNYVEPNAGNVVATGGVGYVKGVVTYTIMDDLTITPMSTISSITILNKFQVKDLSSLDEKTVSLGIDERLELLKASLQSKTVLTDTFLREKKK